jgi:hypothetical protein
MKKTLLLTVLILCTASLAFGETVCGKIGWYDNDDGTDCDLFVPTGFVPAEWWLVHAMCNEVEGVTFKTVVPGCIGFAFGGVITTWGPSPGFELTPWLTIGGYATEIGFAYQACLNGPIILARFDGFGPSSQDCCEFKVEPGDLQGLLCRPCGQPSIPWNLGVISYFQGNLSCPCEEPVAVEESTWGGIKALYGE